jgi:hypothetical protein
MPYNLQCLYNQYSNTQTNQNHPKPHQDPFHSKISIEVLAQVPKSRPCAAAEGAINISGDENEQRPQLLLSLEVDRRMT